MTAAQFRKLALALPDATESAHMGHPDFRVGGKIFATLGYPEHYHAVVLLGPEEQRNFVAEAPAAFAIVTGAWGRAGATQIDLKQAKRLMVDDALASAWERRAPKKLTAETKRSHHRPSPG